MYSYSQAAHSLAHNGILVGSDGHAGQGAGRNNPAMQNVHNVGPLPRGSYTIGAWATHHILGPVSAPLSPQPDETGSLVWLGGRSGFYIHAGAFVGGVEFAGDSEGCIVQPNPVRLAMSQSGDTALEVVE